MLYDNSDYNDLSDENLFNEDLVTEKFKTFFDNHIK